MRRNWAPVGTGEAAKFAWQIERIAPFADIIEEKIAAGREVNDDATTLALLREAGTTAYYPCGRVRMGSNYRVLPDTMLRLHGVGGCAW